MGVDLGTYRARIGQFVPGLSKGVSHSTDIVFILFELTCGALIFIKALLVVQGIEPNPGPWTSNLTTWWPPAVTAIVAVATSYLIVRLTSRKGGQTGEQQEPGDHVEISEEQRVQIFREINTEQVQEVCNQLVEMRNEVQFVFQKPLETLVIGDNNTIESDRVSAARQLIKEQQQCLIEQTKAWIAERRNDSLCVPTKALTAARKLLMENKIVIIRGSSGDGKTHIATELLHSLMGGEEHECQGETLVISKEPIALPKLQSLNKITPNSGLAILIDDMFGFGGSRSQCDVDWWIQRQSFIKPLLEGDMAQSANCVIITIRTDTFNEFRSVITNKVLFGVDNIIDLSSNAYALESERRDILNKYTNELNDFQTFTDTEVDAIVKSSPGIGFPQCCRIFRKTQELHADREAFFKSPLIHLINVIKMFNEQKQAALLYLLFSQNSVAEISLDPEQENVHETTRDNVERVFSISLKETSQTNSTENLSLKRKLQYLRHGFDSLNGSFVSNDNGSFNFYHSSVKDAVALLYGNVTPQGFLRYVSSSCLQYIVASQCSEHMLKIVIPKKLFEHVYKRIVYELDSHDEDRYSYVASLTIWQDNTFLTGFFNWISIHKNIPAKDNWLRKHAEESQAKTNYSFVVYVSRFNNVNLLQHLIKGENPFSDIQMKYALDESLRVGSVTVALFLLDNAITNPDVYSCFAAIEGGKIELLWKLDEYKVITAVGSIDLLETLEKTVSLNSLPYDLDSPYRSLCVNAVDVACLFQRVDMLKWLLKTHPSLLDKEGGPRSILHMSACSGNLQLYTAVQDIITGSEPGEKRAQYITLLKDPRNVTVLHAAALSGSKELCLFIAQELPSLLSRKDNDHYHCLHYAAWSGSLSCYKALEDLVLKDETEEERRNCMLSLVSVKKETVLHEACAHGSKDISLHLFKTFPILISQRDTEGSHCLHSAVWSGILSCYQALELQLFQDKTHEQIQHFLESLMDDNDNTVLHIASESGGKDICMHLCRNFPYLIRRRNRLGQHCLHLAARSGNMSCYQALESYILEEKIDGMYDDLMRQLIDKS